ncbi:MAG: protein phosphatase CheZ [Nitrospira sp.]|nr:protein phosphatase CheZ [Nitrospira sp.]
MSASAGSDDAAPSEAQLYEQLGELARFIDTTLKTITQFSDPMSETTEQLPQAATHLRDLKKLTEEGTHRIMQLVEAVENNRVNMLARLDDAARTLTGPADAARFTDTLNALRKNLEADEKPLVDIITTLAFQDLVAQRVNKLVTIIDEVEHKLLQLVVVFGPYKKGAALADPGKAGDMLKQLDASKTTAMDQNLADEILKQFGFN